MTSRLSSLPTLMGMPINLSELAIERRRLFPASKHRSTRIRKKLIKRFGGEFEEKPGIFLVGDRFIIHPLLWPAIQAKLVPLDGSAPAPLPPPARLFYKPGRGGGFFNLEVC